VLRYQIGRTVSAVSVEDLRPQLLALFPILLAKASLPLHLPHSFLHRLMYSSFPILASLRGTPRGSSQSSPLRTGAKSVVDSLRSVGARVEDLKQYGEQVFTTRIRSEGRSRVKA